MSASSPAVIRSLATVALACCVVAGPGAAGNLALASDSHVRVMAPEISKWPIDGRLVASDEATLTIRTEGRPFRLGWPLRRTSGETVTLPREKVTHFAHLRPSRKKLGATIGGLIGAVVGVVILERARTESEDACTGCGILIAGAATPFALLGAVVAPGYRETAEDPAEVRVGLIPARGGGVGVRLSVAF